MSALFLVHRQTTEDADGEEENGEKDGTTPVMIRHVADLQHEETIIIALTPVDPLLTWFNFDPNMEK